MRTCMREKGYEDREESGGQGSEESRGDEWVDNGVAGRTSPSLRDVSLRVRVP